MELREWGRRGGDQSDPADRLGSNEVTADPTQRPCAHVVAIAEVSGPARWSITDGPRRPFSIALPRQRHMANVKKVRRKRDECLKGAE